MEPFEWNKSVARMTCADFRRWLGHDPPHPHRTNPAYGAPERRPPPSLRTHGDMNVHAALSEEATTAHGENYASHPRKKTGVDEECPLALVTDFDMVLDFTPDMMHIAKGWWHLP
jgi:hypothetical protein